MPLLPKWNDPPSTVPYLSVFILVHPVYLHALPSPFCIYLYSSTVLLLSHHCSLIDYLAFYLRNSTSHKLATMFASRKRAREEDEDEMLELEHEPKLPVGCPFAHQTTCIDGYSRGLAACPSVLHQSPSMSALYLDHQETSLPPYSHRP